MKRQILVKRGNLKVLCNSPEQAAKIVGVIQAEVEKVQAKKKLQTIEDREAAERAQKEWPNNGACVRAKYPMVVLDDRGVEVARLGRFRVGWYDRENAFVCAGAGSSWAEAFARAGVE